MKFKLVFLSLALLGCSGAAPPSDPDSMQPASEMPQEHVLVSFDTDAIGAMPGQFLASRTGGGREGVWRVEQVEGAPSGTQAVVQTDADRTSYRFPLLVYDQFRVRDVDVSVAFQAVSGRVDQAAGLVWRLQNANNYYVVRANAKEDNVVLYKVENGERSDLQVKGRRGNTYGVDVDVPDSGWSTLRVTARGSLFEVYLNGRKLFEVEDSTFGEPGWVGLWTKADSVTRFDDLRIANLDVAEGAGQ